MALREVFTQQVSSGQVAVAWCNSYSAVALRTPEASLLVDPVSISPDPSLRADLLLVSHEHQDHWDPETLAALHRHTGAPVLAPPFVTEQMRRWLPEGAARPFHPWEETSVSGCLVVALPSHHPAREPLSFLLLPVQGPAVYLPGDTSPYPEMTEIRRRWRPQVLVFMGTSLEEGAETCRLLQPAALVTYDWGPPSATERARRMLTRHTPEALFVALKREEVFLYPRAL